MATYATRSQDARLLETPGVTIQARQCMFLPVCVGHVFFVSYELYREHQSERNLTKHHRNTIAPSSCYTPFNKIIATVTKQLASQIIEPWDSPLGPPKGTKKTTWDHLGAPFLQAARRTGAYTSTQSPHDSLKTNVMQRLRPQWIATRVWERQRLIAKCGTSQCRHP